MNRSRTLVAVALFLPIAIEAPAAAGTTVFERPLENEDLTAAHFDVDRDLGRAWIDVEVTPTTVSEVPETEVIPRPLNGLYYDSTRKQVIYRDGSRQVVCAEDWSFIGMKALKDTGQCRLSLSEETRKVDDGFQSREETVGKVVFEATTLSTRGE